jgi:hypothetical protein
MVTTVRTGCHHGIEVAGACSTSTPMRRARSEAAPRRGTDGRVSTPRRHTCPPVLASADRRSASRCDGRRCSPALINCIATAHAAQVAAIEASRRRQHAAAITHRGTPLIKPSVGPVKRGKPRSSSGLTRLKRQPDPRPPPASPKRPAPLLGETCQRHDEESVSSCRRSTRQLMSPVTVRVRLVRHIRAMVAAVHWQRVRAETPARAHPKSKHAANVASVLPAVKLPLSAESPQCRTSVFAELHEPPRQERPTCTTAVCNGIADTSLDVADDPILSNRGARVR